MDELVNLVAQKANIAPEQARTAVTTVVNFIKERLPEPIAGQIEAVMGGQMPDMGALGGLLGKK